MKQVIKQGMILLLLVLSVGGYAQQRTKESLQKEINALQKEIETANKLLAETSKNKEVTLNQVTLLDKKIRNRQKLINAYNEQINMLNTQIQQGESNINALNQTIQKLQGELAQMLQFAYRNRSHYDRLEFLFASKDFNQALQRMRYIRQFADARQRKMNQIAGTRKQVTAEVEADRQARAEQEALLAEEQAQQETLRREKEELNAQLAQLKKKEGTIKQGIKDKQAQAKKFQKQIDDIIAEEIRKANERAAKEAKGKAEANTKPDKMALTPSEKVLSTTFSANKGKLPWPVERGVVSSSFGKHASAVSDQVTVTNNGVDIATTENAVARCVFEGVVVSVVKPSASNIGVIIRHGDYFTVYSQLDEVYVNRGDKVKTKQTIGKVHTDRSEGKTEIHFELRRGTETLNPSQWLSK